LGRWVCPGVCRDIETQCWQSPSIKERNTSYLKKIWNVSTQYIHLQQLVFENKSWTQYQLG
jgi:hypothetical protein